MWHQNDLDLAGAPGFKVRDQRSQLYFFLFFFMDEFEGTRKLGLSEWLQVSLVNLLGYDEFNAAASSAVVLPFSFFF